MTEIKQLASQYLALEEELYNELTGLPNFGEGCKCAIPDPVGFVVGCENEAFVQRRCLNCGGLI